MKRLAIFKLGGLALLLVLGGCSWSRLTFQDHQTQDNSQDISSRQEEPLQYNDAAPEPPLILNHPSAQTQLMRSLGANLGARIRGQEFFLSWNRDGDGSLVDVITNEYLGRIDPQTEDVYWELIEILYQNPKVQGIWR